MTAKPLDLESVPFFHDGKRIHPRAKVGDHFGVRVVVKLLPRDASSNERVLTRCTLCGDERKAYVFNLRKQKVGCRCKRAQVPTR